MASNGEPGADYFVLLGRLKIQQKNFIEAEENLKQAIVLKHEVGPLQECSVVYIYQTRQRVLHPISKHRELSGLEKWSAAE